GSGSPRRSISTWSGGRTESSEEGKTMPDSIREMPKPESIKDRPKLHDWIQKVVKEKHAQLAHDFAGFEHGREAFAGEIARSADGGDHLLAKSGEKVFGLARRTEDWMDHLFNHFTDPPRLFSGGGGTPLDAEESGEGEEASELVA